MFNPHTQTQVPAQQGHDTLSSALPPLQPRNFLNRPELRAARERHNSGSLTPLNTSPAPNDRTNRGYEQIATDERLLSASAWRAVDVGRNNELSRAESVPAAGEKEEIPTDLWDKENVLERKIAEVENARRTSEDRHQKELAARITIERRATKLERKVSDMDDALKNAERRFQRETNARNAIEKHASRLEKKLVSLEENVISSEKRYQRESNGRIMVEGRVAELDKKLCKLENEHKAAQDVYKRETDIRNAIANSISDLQERVTTIANTLRNAEERYQNAVDAGVVTDKRAANLDLPFNKLQGQLITEKTAVDVEKSNVQQLKAELANSNYRLEKEAALLRSERMKTKILADREAERLNTSSEERVRIAQEKLKVLSSALSEEREKSKKLKDVLTGVQTELNTFKRKAGSTDVLLGSCVDSETQGEKSEHARTQSTSSQSAGDQQVSAQSIVSHGPDRAETLSMGAVGDRKLPYPCCHKLPQHSVCPPLPGSDEPPISKQQPASRSGENSPESLACELQTAIQLQNVPNKDTPAEAATKGLHSKGDHHLSRNGNPTAGYQAVNNKESAAGQQPPTAKKIRSEEERCFEPKRSPDVPTETRFTSLRPAIQGQSTCPTNFPQSVPSAPVEHTASGLSDTQKSIAPSRGIAPAPRVAPLQKCRALQKISETQGYPAPRNNGHTFQRYVPSQLFVPGPPRARPWDLDHPDNFAPRQHLSFTETPFPFQFAPAQIAPASEGYSGPQLLAQPYPVDSPQRHPLSRRPPVTTATRSLYTNDVSGLSRNQK